MSLFLFRDQGRYGPSDTVEGGAGNDDVFRYRNVAESAFGNPDQILDFSRATGST